MHGLGFVKMRDCCTTFRDIVASCYVNNEVECKASAKSREIMPTDFNGHSFSRGDQGKSIFKFRFAQHASG